MKQIYIFTAILFLSLSKSNGQISDIEIGENPYIIDQSQRYQFLPTAFSNAKMQFLLTNTELTNGGLTNGSEIVGIQWYVDTDNTDLTSTFDLYIDDDFTGNSLSSDPTFSIITSTLVGDDLTDSGQSTGWHTATFTNSFIWDGTDNFILQLCRTGGSQSGDDIIQLVDTNSEYRFVSGYLNNCSSTTGTYSQTFRPFFRLMVTTSTLTTLDFEQENLIKFYPNPSSDFVQISGLTEKMKYSLYNILGSKITEGTISNNEKIGIQNLMNGLYFLTFDNGNTIKFIKK
jgi:hypothetical protein